MILSEMYKNFSASVHDNDFILIEYNLFFNRELSTYNLFAIDDEDELEWLMQLIADWRNQEKINIYVCAYAKEINNPNGDKAIYADSLWISTQKSIEDVKILFEKNTILEPSDISLVRNTEEFSQENIFLFKTTGDVVNLNKCTDITQLGDMKCLYWD